MRVSRVSDRLPMRSRPLLQLLPPTLHCLQVPFMQIWYVDNLNRINGFRMQCAFSLSLKRIARIANVVECQSLVSGHYRFLSWFSGWNWMKIHKLWDPQCGCLYEHNLQGAWRCSWMLLPCRLVRRQMPAATGLIWSGRRPLAQRQRGRPQHPRRLSCCHLCRPSPSSCCSRPRPLQVEAAAKDSPEKVSWIKIVLADINFQGSYQQLHPRCHPQTAVEGEILGWAENIFHTTSLLIWLFTVRTV